MAATITQAKPSIEEVDRPKVIIFYSIWFTFWTALTFYALYHNWVTRHEDNTAIKKAKEAEAEQKEIAKRNNNKTRATSAQAENSAGPTGSQVN